MGRPMSADLALARIEAILVDIESQDAASKGQFRQATDGEALGIVMAILANHEGKHAA